MKRFAVLGVLAAFSMMQVPPLEQATDPDRGQVPGPGGVGDSTIMDNRGFEGNFVRIKSHCDYFDWTNWGPDPTLTPPVSETEPLPPHMLELRDSSGQVLMRYVAVGPYDSAGQFNFTGSVNASQGVGIGAGGIRYSAGHLQWSEDRSVWHDFQGNSSRAAF